jgi:hypothetical protein
VDSNGHVTDSDAGEVTSLLQTLTAMVQMQAESVRLQRLLVEHLLGQAPPPAPPTDCAPSPAEQKLSHGARYYQRRGAASVPTVTPQHVDLLCRLQEIRDAGDLILQFGPHKGTTLAQVAVHHPDYIRELVTHAQRPAVRAAAARIVEALDASAPPRRRRRAVA